MVAAVNLSLTYVFVAKFANCWSRVYGECRERCFSTTCITALFSSDVSAVKETDNKTDNINLSLLPTKFLQQANLAIFTALSLSNPLGVLFPHLLSPFLVRQLSPH